MKGDKLKKENSNSKIIKKIQKNFSNIKIIYKIVTKFYQKQKTYVRFFFKILEICENKEKITASKCGKL